VRTTFMHYPEADENGTPPLGARSASSVYHRLLYTVFQRPREMSVGTVVALTSSNSGEGVTYVARQLANELTGWERTSVACVNVHFLRRLHEPTIEAIRNSLTKLGVGSSPGERPERALVATERRGPWDNSWQYRRECIELLRSEFEHTIVDCPALEKSGDLLSVAPFVDGVIVVVEANRTRRDQPRLAEQTVAAAGGKLLGYILNKHTDEIPQWLDRKL
jgi:Mrp family chromosome partitioning ATPase